MKMTIASVAAVGIVMMLASTASAASKVENPDVSVNVTAVHPQDAQAADCDPSAPLVDWLICVVNEGVDVPQWVQDQLDNAFQTVKNVRDRACFEYERLTGDPCPL